MMTFNVKNKTKAANDPLVPDKNQMFQHVTWEKFHVGELLKMIENNKDFLQNAKNLEDASVGGGY